MKCKEWKAHFNAWLSQHWLIEDKVDDIPDVLKAHVSDCPECKKRLLSAQILGKSVDFQDKAPENLAEKINTYVLTRGSQKKKSIPRWIMVPLAAAALVIITFIFTITFFTQPKNTITIHLMIDVPDATCVSVVGDWNNWDPDVDVLTDPDGDGRWEIKLHLNKNNEYRYQFLVNKEEWLPDPQSPLQIEDGFGGVNSILEI
ncbi:MAG: hypothetical protein JXJ04_03990 [Spirochaetales bacterium]|nr:hypothetical protein [Spirochaetales bacterium]